MFEEMSTFDSSTTTLNQCLDHNQSDATHKGLNLCASPYYHIICHPKKSPNNMFKCVVSVPGKFLFYSILFYSILTPHITAPAATTTTTTPSMHLQHPGLRFHPQHLIYTISLPFTCSPRPKPLFQAPTPSLYSFSTPWPAFLPQHLPSTCFSTPKQGF